MYTKNILFHLNNQWVWAIFLLNYFLSYRSNLLTPYGWKFSSPVWVVDQICNLRYVILTFGCQCRWSSATDVYMNSIILYTLLILSLTEFKVSLNVILLINWNYIWRSLCIEKYFISVSLSIYLNKLCPCILFGCGRFFPFFSPCYLKSLFYLMSIKAFCVTTPVPRVSLIFLVLFSNKINICSW